VTRRDREALAKLAGAVAALSSALYAKTSNDTGQTFAFLREAHGAARGAEMLLSRPTRRKGAQ
jgi:hypothetical protein